MGLMDILMSFGSNPLEILMRLGSMGGALANTQAQSELTQEYEEEVDFDIDRYLELAEERPQEAMDMFRNWMGQAQRQLYQSGAQTLEQAGALPGMYATNRMDFLGDLSGSNQDIMGGYGDRYRFAEEQVEGYGQQQAQDIDRYYDEQQAESRMRLGSRGLLSSTEATTQDAAVAERRAASQGRLQEDLMRNRVQILSDLSGQGLSAQERMGNVEAAYDAAWRGDVLGAEERQIGYQQGVHGDLANFYQNMASGTAGLYTGTTGDQLNAYGNINRIPPQPSNLNWLLGQGVVQPPSNPNATDYYNASLGADGARMIAAMFSDKNMKHDIHSIDYQDILDRLDSMPVQSWKYNGSEITHVGPMAQDFQAAFGLGNGRVINVVDAIGVLMASIRALSEEVRSLKAKVA